jgi:hypothetical protein
MAATQTAVSDGTLNIIEVSIPYFEEGDISVALDFDTALTAGTDYLWTSGTSIQFQNTTHTPGGLVPTGVTVLLRRNTKDDAMYNTFDGGAAFSRAALDENFKQLLYREQEFSAGLGIEGLNNDLSMNGYHITDLGDAVADTDAANLGQVKDAVAVETTARQAGDAALQDQLLGVTPPAGSAFSQISWHGQSILTSMNIPPNVNAWSFGPVLTIAQGQQVSIGAGSFWTIANGATTQEGPLVAEFPDNLDLGVLT